MFSLTINYMVIFSLSLSFTGGSESFNDKRDFFNRELVAYHGRKSGEVNLKIDRHKLLESVSYPTSLCIPHC